MPAQTSDDLVAELRRLNLLTGEAARGLASAVGSRRLSPKQLAPLLGRAGFTRFQVQAALSGQAERLAFGPYVLLDKLGDGGMGVVYKARHVRLGRIDAVKVLRTDRVGSRTLARRFLREIELTSALEHPHIVYAHDAGIVGGRLYLATEFVDGTDLATAVRRTGPLSVAEACLVIYQTALALRHVHEKGLVHRDLKPSNLLRANGTGAVKLLDLGLSGFNRVELGPGAGATLTRDGVLLGTPDFMAPEQAEDPRGVDIRADLYGLGCTFFFLLTGRPPYSGSQIEKLFKHSYAPPPSLVLPSRRTPPGLAFVVTRLMAKHPGERFQTPQDVIDAMLALRPKAGEVGGNPADTTPPPVGALALGLLPGEDLRFEDLLGANSDEAPAPADAARGSWRWVGLALLMLLFGLGFLMAALTFSGM